MLHPTEEHIAYMQAHATDDRRPWFVGVNVAFLALAYIAIGLRIMSRLKIKTAIGWDDWLICGAAMLVTGHVICLLITVHLGMGRHAIFVTNLKAFAVTSLVAQTFYNLSIGTIKLSILALYARIFRRTSGWFTPTLYVTALFVFLIMIPQCFTYIFQCVPIDSLWTEYGPGKRVVCINFQATIIAFGVINIITDWWILALPIPVVIGLHLERRTKLSICSLFLIGLFVCVISIVRLFYAKRVASTDPSWDYAPISVISTVEGASGILAACMPTWRPLFKFLRHGIGSYFSGNKSNSEPTSHQSNLNLEYGNTTNVGRGRWYTRSSKKSRNRSAGGLRINHYGMGTGMVKSMTGKRSETSMSGESFEKILRPESGGIEMDTKPSPDVSVSISATDAKPTPKRSPSRTKKAKRHPSNDFDGGISAVTGGGKPTYEAKAGADRWEGLMRQQRIKNESEERERELAKGRASPAPHQHSKTTGKGRGYGDVAFGGRVVSSGSERGVALGSGGRTSRLGVGRSSEDDGGARSGGGGWGLGLEGIVVTKTVDCVTDSGDVEAGRGR